jgi:hypothetical protein
MAVLQTAHRNLLLLCLLLYYPSKNDGLAKGRGRGLTKEFVFKDTTERWQ